MSEGYQEIDGVFSRCEKYRHLRKLEADWNRLYEANPGLCPYQSFSFCKEVMSVARLSPRRYNLAPRFYVFYGRDDRVRLIAPVYVRRDHRGSRVTLLTDHTPAGYADLIYPPDLTQEEFDAALAGIDKDLGAPRFLFRRIYEGSHLNQYLQQGQADLFKTDSYICNEIPLWDDYSSYWAGLSKSARQNIRTARNRLVRDGHTYKLNLIQGEGLSYSTVRMIMDIYLKRRFECEYLGLKSRLLGFSKRHLNPVTRALGKSRDTVLAILEIEGEPAAFCAGFGRTGGRLVIPLLSIDSKWGRYSPGGLLITGLMKKLHEEKKYTSVDLSRGGESYKYRYGGKEHLNYIYEFRII